MNQATTKKMKRYTATVGYMVVDFGVVEVLDKQTVSVEATSEFEARGKIDAMMSDDIDDVVVFQINEQL